MSKVYVSGQIYENKPDVKFFKDGKEVIASEVIFSEYGQILSIITPDKVEIPVDKLSVCTDFLHVPGVGYLSPGTTVRLNKSEYILNFGEHVNISNQRMISWYLTPIVRESTPDPLGRVVSEDRTLYMYMIDMIDLVTV